MPLKFLHLVSNLLEDVQYCVQAFLLICTSVFPNIPASCTFFSPIFSLLFYVDPKFCFNVVHCVSTFLKSVVCVPWTLCIVFPNFLWFVHCVSNFPFSCILFSLQMILYFFTLFPTFASNLYHIVSTLLKSVHVVSEYFLRLYMLSSIFPRLWFSNVPRTWCILFLDLCLFFSQLYSFHLYILLLSFTFICTFVSRMFF